MLLNCILPRWLPYNTASPAMVTATLANCNFVSPAMFTIIAGVRNEPTEAASHEKEGAGAVEVRYWHKADISMLVINVRFFGVTADITQRLFVPKISSSDDFNSGR